MLVRQSLSRVRPRRLLPLVSLLTAVTLVSCGQPADDEASSDPEVNASSLEESSDGDPDASLEESPGEHADDMTAQDFVDRIGDGGAADYNATQHHPELVQASSLVILGEMIDVRPGLQIERENPIPEGYEPNELIDEDDENFTHDPEAGGPPARTLPERSTFYSFVAVDVRVEDSLTANASPGDVVTIQVMSGQETADGDADLDHRGPVLVAGEALPESWADNERLHFDWGEAPPTPLSETYSPFMDGFWLDASDGIVGVRGTQLSESFGEPDDVGELFETLGSSSDTDPGAESGAGQAGMSPAEIREVAIEGDDERRLILDVSYCDAEIARDVNESDTEVTITVTHRNLAGDDCGGGVVVQLDDPLGERVVIDGTNDEPVAAIRHPADTGS